MPAESIARNVNSFTWYGETYTETPAVAPTHTFTNALGCGKLVDGSAWCVSYCNRPRTGTAYTVKYALDHGVKVYNASSFSLRNLV